MWSSGFNRRVAGPCDVTGRAEEVRLEHAVGRSAAAALDGSIKPRRRHLLQSSGERHGVNAFQGRHGVSLATRAKVV